MNVGEVAGTASASGVSAEAILSNRSGGVVLLRVDREAARHTGHPRHLHPALDLKYIQARLEDALGAPVLLFDGWLGRFSVEQSIAVVLACRPRYAVIRAVTWCLEESVRVGAALREHGVVTIAVGQQVQHVARTGFPGWDRAFDLVLPGEPEEEVPRLVLRLRAGEPLAALQVNAAVVSTRVSPNSSANPTRCRSRASASANCAITRFRSRSGAGRSRAGAMC